MKYARVFLGIRYTHMHVYVWLGRRPYKLITRKTERCEKGRRCWCVCAHVNRSLLSSVLTIIYWDGICRAIDTASAVIEFRRPGWCGAVRVYTMHTRNEPNPFN